MKTKLFQVLVILLLCVTPLSINAVNYFFTTSGAGDKDGSSWENAAEGDILGLSLTSFEVGDSIFLGGGTYYPNMDDGFWTIPQGITIIGGFPVTMSGVDTKIEYPSTSETFFSADYDGDGIGDNSGIGFIQIINPETTGVKENFKKATIQGITITKSLYNGSSYKGGAMIVKNANVELNFVKFIDNVNGKTDGTLVKGGVLVTWGSYITCKDCIFRNNKSGAAGAAINLRQSGGGTSADVNDRCVGIFDRCEFTNNGSYDATNTSSTYGGAAAIADYGGILYLNNCTFSGSEIYANGGVLRVSTNCVLYCLNSTFVNNYALRADKGYGEVMSLGTGTSNFFANNVIVNTTDDFNVAKALIYIQAASTACISGGYNVWGTIQNNSQQYTFLASDKLTESASVVYTTPNVFGTNILTNNGGWSNTIKPEMNISGMSVDNLLSLRNNWNLPTSIDVTLDQRGYTRSATTMSGAMDANGIAPVKTSVVKNIVNPMNISCVGDGYYKVEGVEGDAVVYCIDGRIIMRMDTLINGSVIDLSSQDNGIYIISINGFNQKVIR